MKLGKWLAINRCIERVDRSSGKFVFRGGMNILSEPCSKGYSFVAPFDEVSSRETETKNTETRNIVLAKKTATETSGTIIQNNNFEIKKSLVVDDTQLDLKVLQRQNNSNDSEIENKQQTTSKIGRMVGRWAIRTQQTMPKPSPIQTEFKFKSVEVLRNDLTCADIEIRVVRGGKNGGAGKAIDFLRSVKKFAERFLGFISSKIRL